MAHQSLQVLARLDWRDARNKTISEPDYVYQTRREGSWTRLTLETQAHQSASAVTLQLYVSNACNSAVSWDDVALEQIAAPQPRVRAFSSRRF